jgi:hypothetical protein
MIRYTLKCARDHEFEAWFGSSADYDRAAAAGENRCPACGSTEVEKAPMAPAVAGKKGRGEHHDKVQLAAPDPRHVAFREAVKEFRRKLTESADYVGDRFAEEARRIHYDEITPHSIYGEATLDEAKRLAEEGVSFQPLPPIPDDSN